MYFLHSNSSEESALFLMDRCLARELLTLPYSYTNCSRRLVFDKETVTLLAWSNFFFLYEGKEMGQMTLLS